MPNVGFSHIAERTLIKVFTVLHRASLSIVRNFSSSSVDKLRLLVKSAVRNNSNNLLHRRQGSSSSLPNANLIWGTFFEVLQTIDLWAPDRGIRNGSITPLLLTLLFVEIGQFV